MAKWKCFTLCECQCGVVAKVLDWELGDSGSSPYGHGSSLGDFGPVTGSQHNLPHRVVVARITWRGGGLGFLGGKKVGYKCNK